MSGAYRAVLFVHVALGCVALVAFWAALLQRKGSPVHRGLGRVFVWTMSATASSALLLCVAVYVLDPAAVRPPGPGLSAAELSAYASSIRALFGGLAVAGVSVLGFLALAMRAVQRGRIVEHVFWILSAGIVGHTAFFVSILPRLLPVVHEPDPTKNPLPWVLPPLFGAAVVVWACLWARRRYPPQPGAVRGSAPAEAGLPSRAA
jgi:uncharacterized membrane protein YozB (DUF420 family)